MNNHNKMKYQAPIIKKTWLGITSLMTGSESLSKSAIGDIGDDAESRAFCGHSIFEAETDEDELDINE